MCLTREGRPVESELSWTEPGRRCPWSWKLWSFLGSRSWVWEMGGWVHLAAECHTGNCGLAEMMSTVCGITMSSDITVIGGCWCRVGWPGWHTAAPHLPASSTL